MSFAMVHEKLRYDPDTGVLRWRKSGRVAGHSGKQYVEVRFTKVIRVLGHRLAWLLHYGEWPPASLVVDHINRDKHDNRIANLRAISHGDNLRNSEKTDNGGSCYCKQTGKWKAYRKINGKQIWFGRFPTRDAALAAVRARTESGVVTFHGETK